MAQTVTVNDLLDGYGGLDIECLDRIYLNGYVPNLQVARNTITRSVHEVGLAASFGGTLANAVDPNVAGARVWAARRPGGESLADPIAKRRDAEQGAVRDQRRRRWPERSACSSPACSPAVTCSSGR
jgi:hypothetical protein